MDEDLQTNPPRDDWYEWAISSFYITYILFEWMSLLWKVFPAHIYVSTLVLSWGVIASLQALATSYPMLVCLRAALGIGEAGFTGVPFYLSFFYKRNELAFRTAIFISGKAFNTFPPIPFLLAALALTFNRSRSASQFLRLLPSVAHRQIRRGQPNSSLARPLPS